MQAINNLTNPAVRLIESRPESNSEAESAKRLWRVNGKLVTTLDLLWGRMTEIYGHRWTSAYGDSPVDGWEIALTGITPEMIRLGLGRMATERRYADWPPAALEFRALCLPTAEDMGLPTEAEALAQAVGNRTAKHPAVIHTLREHIDGHNLRRMTEMDARRAWAKAWAATVDYVASGGDLPEPVAEIEDKPVRASRETAVGALSGLRGMLA